MKSNSDKKLIKQITSKDNPPQEVDEVKVDNENSDNFPKQTEYEKTIANFNDHYRYRNKHNRWMKIWFFSLAFFCLIGALVLCFYIVIKLLNNEGFTIEHLAGIIAALGTFLTSLLVLPKMIGTYLYPNNKTKDEDEAILKFISEMRHEDISEKKIGTNDNMRMSNEVQVLQALESESEQSQEQEKKK